MDVLNLSPSEKRIRNLSLKWGVALTGAIATGKSTVGQYLTGAGCPVFDADHLARKVVEPGTPGLAEIVQSFGSEVLHSDGSLNRKTLGSLVFAIEDQKSTRARMTLERILHPKIQQELASRLDEEGLFDSPRLWFYEAALIFEKDRGSDFLEVWATFCDPALQLQRIGNRDQKSPQQAESIVASQISAHEKAQRADFAIDTGLPTPEVRKRVLARTHELQVQMSQRVFLT